MDGRYPSNPLLVLCSSIYVFNSTQIYIFFHFSYRHCGGTCEVRKLMQLALAKRKKNSGDQRLNLADNQWEIETISSAVKVQTNTNSKPINMLILNRPSCATYPSHWWHLSFTTNSSLAQKSTILNNGECNIDYCSMFILKLCKSSLQSKALVTWVRTKQLHLLWPVRG